MYLVSDPSSFTQTPSLILDILSNISALVSDTDIDRCTVVKHGQHPRQTCLCMNKISDTEQKCQNFRIIFMGWKG